MLKLVSWSFGLILSTSIVPLASLVISATVQAAENIEIKPAIANNAAHQTDRYAQMSNTDRRIIQENQRLQNIIMIKDQQRRQQEAQEAWNKLTPQQKREKQEAANRQSQTQEQERIANQMRSIQELERKGDYMAVGKLKQENADLNGAIVAYNKAIASNQTPTLAYYFIGEIKAKKKDLKGAINAYSQSIAAYPNNFKAYFGRAAVKALMNDREGFQQDYDQGTRISKTLKECMERYNDFRKCG
jgi:tetratricopeptide (TPR) repeat protein